MSKLSEAQHARIRELEAAYPTLEYDDETAHEIAYALYTMRFEPHSKRGKELWAQDSELVTWSAEAPDAKAIDPRARAFADFRDILTEDIPDWDELFTRAGIRGQRTQGNQNNNASVVVPNQNNAVRQQNSIMRQQSSNSVVPVANQNTQVNAVQTNTSRPQGRGRSNQGSTAPAPRARGPLYNAYTTNDDLNWTGGEQLRTIFCGLDPDKKPPWAVWGNRYQCLQKGYMLRKGKVTAW